MKKLIYLIVFLVLLAGSFFVGSWYGRRSAGVPLPEAAGRGGETASPESALPASLPGSVEISPEKQQLIGVKTEDVRKATGKSTIRILGRAAVDETRVYAVTAALDGWITEAMPIATGSFIKKNEILARFYSPEFLSAEQALLYALGAKDRVIALGEEAGAATDGQKNQLAQFELNLRQYKESLLNIGMGDLQIDEIIRTRLFTEHVNITSPIDGFVLRRNISRGLRFEKGTEFFRIADLSHVWVLMDTYGDEAERLRRGDRVAVSLPGKQKTLAGRVSRTLPQFDPATRTLKVRLEVDNPGYALKPDMFVEVELPVTLPPAIIVPVDAVLDSGLKKTVFIDRGNGFFEPREVETGHRLGSQVEITRGLAEGERIVVSGNFLIDSESRMARAAAGMEEGLSRDPVCGAKVSVNRAQREGRLSVYRGTTYYFSSEACKKTFDGKPDRYVKRSASSLAPARPVSATGAPDRKCAHE